MSEWSQEQERSYKSAIARFYRGNKVIGAGFLVEGGYLLSCAHVVDQSLGASKQDDPVGQELKVNFPFVNLGQKLTATVLCYRLQESEGEDVDVAGLQLLDPIPQGVIPIRLNADYFFNDGFHVYGFPDGRPKGVGANGQLVGERAGNWVQMEATKTEGYAIERGFSGSPVWDFRSSSVVGMTVARDKDNEAAKVAFMLPSRMLWPTLRVVNSQSLLTILEQHEEAIADSINVVYSLFPQLKAASTLSEKLQNLQNAIDGVNDPAALHQFVALLSSPDLPDSDLSDEVRNQLHAWLDVNVDDVQTVLDFVQPQLSKQKAIQSEVIESHLLIHVQVNQSGGSVYDVSARFVPHYKPDQGKVLEREMVKAPEEDRFNGKVEKGTLSELVQACVDEVNQRSPKNLTINLILPLALMDEAIDGVPLPNIQAPEVAQILPGFSPPVLRMGDRYRLVIRSAERIFPYIYQQHGELWEKKWKSLPALRKSDVCAAFLPGDRVKTKEGLWSQLNDPNVVGLKCAQAFDAISCNEVISTLITAGIPAAIWVRENDLEPTVDCVREIDRLLKCKIYDLPEVVRQKRSESVAKDKSVHIGHHLSLLWEDPILVPATTQSSLGMPRS